MKSLSANPAPVKAGPPVALALLLPTVLVLLAAAEVARGDITEDQYRLYLAEVGRREAAMKKAHRAVERRMTLEQLTEPEREYVRKFCVTGFARHPGRTGKAAVFVRSREVTEWRRAITFYRAIAGVAAPITLDDDSPDPGEYRRPADLPPARQGGAK